MNRFIKIVMLCLLALSLPMQGFASALMPDCGAGHNGDAMQMSEHHVEPPAHAMHAAASEHDGVTKNIVKSISKCSECVACCFSTAAVPFLVPAVMPALDAAYSYGAPPAPDFTVNFPDGLERPPHTFSL